MQLAMDLQQTSVELKQRTEDDAHLVAKSEALTCVLLDDLQISHHQITTSMTSMSGISAELKADINRALVSIQFQDRVSQRVAHVIESIEYLVGWLNPSSSEKSYAATRNLLLSEIGSRFTMQAERDIVDRPSTGFTKAAAKSANSMSVELF
jgi:methyl-accepting chemotaxis protein